MRFVAQFRSAAKVFHRSQVEEDVAEELWSHIAHRADDLERSGVNPEEAERRARIEFGGQGRLKEECREALGGNFLDTLAQDVRFSVRLLRRSPGFAVVAVLTLALAIGTNAVVFGVLDALILRPLNVPRAESLYGIQLGTGHFPAQSYPDYLDLRDRNRSFDGLAAYNIATAGLDTGESASPAWVYEVSGNYFDVLGVQPRLGRFFHASDEHGANSAPYLVLSYTYWHNHFEDDRGVVGRTVRINKHPFTILGVAPPGFNGTLSFFVPDFFVPIVDEEQIEGSNFLNARGNRWVFMTMGHLRAGVSPAQAVADLNSIGAYLEKNYPKDDGNMIFGLARPGLYGDYLDRPIRGFLTALLLLAGLILLAACANLGSLFAAHTADRSREVALRLALGSSRNRILRGMLTEALLISLAGCAVGLWGSVELLHALSVWRPFPQFPIHVSVNPGASVYAIALGLAVVSGILFGATPVRQVLRTNAYEVIKSGSTGRVGRRIRLRDLLLSTQIALCAVLVTSSLVAVRGLVRSLHGNFGFTPQNTMLAQTDLGMAGYPSDAVPVMQKRMMDAIRTIPGVTAVGFINEPPLANGRPTSETVFTDESTDLRPANAVTAAILYSISPGYFHAAGTASLTGRDVSWHDDKSTPRVAVVSQEFARKLFGSGSKAVGRHYKLPDGTRVEVVGVVEDGKYTSLTEDAQPAMFFPILQAPSSSTSLVIRLGGNSQQWAKRSRVRSASWMRDCLV